jgi:5-methylcytosine-specific restriction endonuclease McrA
MKTIQKLTAIPDDELLRRLADLLRDSRRTEADLVAHVGEVDARRLYAREASPSMFVYCTERLHLSEAEAYLRIAAGRACRDHPVLLTMLADGRLHLTAIAKLAPHLTAQNREDLVKLATHRTKREIDELLASFAPRPDAPVLIRKLPERRPDSAGRQSAVHGPALSSATDRILDPDATVPLGSEVGPPGEAAAAASWRDGHALLATELRPDAVLLDGSDALATPALDRGEQGRPGEAAAGHAHGAVVEPLSPARYRVQFTVTAELRDKLERLRALMRSSVPDGDLAAVIDAAVTEKLERLEGRRFGLTTTPRTSVGDSHGEPSSRHVPAAVRRAVYERDQGQCRFVDREGRRCPARVGLQFHHRHPFGLGGHHCVSNVALLCAAHNRHIAEADYGPGVGRGRRRSALPVQPVSRSPGQPVLQT